MEIMKDIKKNNQVGMNTRQNKLSAYQRCLLNAGPDNMAKIPGTFARRSILKQVFATKTLTVNANGHLGLNYLPYISDSSDANSTFYYTNAVAYDPAVSPASTTGTAAENTSHFLITSTSVRQSRLVSMKLKVYSLSTTLNRTGTIYGALLHTAPIVQVPVGAIAALNMYTVPSIQNCLSKKANVSNGEGVIVCYMPSDDDDLQFYPCNLYPNLRHTNGDDAYTIVVICQGLQASSQIRIEINSVFELIPWEGTSLAGLETAAPIINTIPALEIGHVRNYHSNDIIRLCNAFDGGETLTTSNEPANLRNKERRKWLKSVPETGNAPKLPNIGDVPSLGNIRNFNPNPKNNVALGLLASALAGSIVGMGGKRNLTGKPQKNQKRRVNIIKK